MFARYRSFMEKYDRLMLALLDIKPRHFLYVALVIVPASLWPVTSEAAMLFAFLLLPYMCALAVIAGFLMLLDAHESMWGFRVFAAAAALLGIAALWATVVHIRFDLLF